MNELVFYPLAALSVLAAFGVVLTNDPIRSALSLVCSMVLLAVFYVVLGAHLVAALQIIVYAGAVMVLFLFVITLLNLRRDPTDSGRPVMTAVATVSGIVLAALLGNAVWDSTLPAASNAPLAEGFGTTVGIARQLFSEYIVAFELTSVLLLVAVVGAVVLAKREPVATEGTEG